MGSSASKGARASGVAGAAARKYPTRVPRVSNQAPAAPAASAVPARGPQQASQKQSEVVDVDAQDAKDAAFASRLTSIGAVQPNPHYSPTSTSAFDPQRNASHHLPPDAMQAPPQPAFPDLRGNPALRALQARQRIQDEAERELEGIGRRGFEGRRYVDASTIQLALMRRKHGQPDQQIEDGLGIRRGRLGALRDKLVEAV